MTRNRSTARLVAVVAHCVHVGHKARTLGPAVGHIDQGPRGIVNVIRIGMNNAGAQHHSAHALRLGASIVRRQMTERQPVRGMFTLGGFRNMALERSNAVKSNADLTARLNGPHQPTLALATA